MQGAALTTPNPRRPPVCLWREGERVRVYACERVSARVRESVCAASACQTSNKTEVSKPSEAARVEFRAMGSVNSHPPPRPASRALSLCPPPNPALGRRLPGDHLREK